MPRQKRQPPNASTPPPPGASNGPPQGSPPPLALTPPVRRAPGSPTWSTYGRERPPPPPKPGGPLTFLFEINDEPTYDHPLWTELASTVPSVRVEVRGRYDQDGNFSWEPASGPSDTVYGVMTKLNRRLNGFARTLRTRPFRWFLIPAGFGAARTDQEIAKYPNAIPLLNNPADRLASGRRGPFFKHGMERNRRWSAEFFEHLAAEIKQRSLPDPEAVILTSEYGVGDDYDGHSGDPDTGWVPEALADPRARDPEQTIDGTRTFAEYMALSRTLDGKPVPPYRHRGLLGVPPGRAPANDESSEQYRGAMRLAWDWSREQACFAIARDAFRRDPAKPFKTVKSGEYDAACDSPWAPVRARPRTLLHQMDGVFHTDLQCPGWYGGLWLRKEDFFQKDDPGWETADNWLAVYPNDEKNPDKRLRRVCLDASKAIAEASAKSAPHAPLMPFVASCNGLNEEDAVEYLRHCREHGAWGACVFMPKVTKEEQDYWRRVIPRVNA